MQSIKLRVKLKGDAGVYSVWAVDLLNEKAQIYRASSYEWVPFKKIQATMRYSGKDDKNGQRVFEGDFLEARVLPTKRVTYPLEVVWDHDRACFAVKSGGKQTNLNDYFSAIYELEVIGNRWENPALLKEVSP